MDAFAPHWLQKFGTVYDDTALPDITWFTGAATPRLVELVSHGAIPRGARVVDLGCGPGVDALFLALQGMRVTAIDRSATALEVARKTAALWGVEVDWVEGDVLGTPLEDASADAVNDSFIFHNVAPEMRAPYAREVARLLRPGGLYVMRGYSDRMPAGTGSFRLTADDIFAAFNPDFECELLKREQGLPTAQKANQLHWVTVWRRRGVAVAQQALGGAT